MRYAFGLFWGFFISQLASLVLVLCALIFLPISSLPSTPFIYGMSFVGGLILFVLLKPHFRKPSIVVGVISILIFFLSVVCVPLLGKTLGDKAARIENSKP